MDDLNATLSRLLADPAAAPSAQWVEEMRRLHPAWTLPAALLLRRAGADLPPAERQEMQMHLALNSPDRAALVEMVDLEGYQWADMFPPQMPPQPPSTESAIDTFLSTYGTSSPCETTMLEQMIFNPAPADYFSEADAPSHPADGLPLLPPELARTSESPESPESSESSESAGSPDMPHPEPTAPPRRPETPAPSDSSTLSESLAKIFIKQRRYERAYEIISNLNLKFPEKSVYFADQLRFLRKLINLQRQQSQN